MRRVRFILRKSPKRFLTFLACLVGFCYFVVAQGPYYSWDFSDCEIKDILYAVSLDSEISIVPDDTVSGKGDLKFAGSDFDSAFETFLRVNRLFVNKGDKVWTVSKFMAKREAGLLYVDACDLSPAQILEKLSSFVDCVITFDSLPSARVSVHFNGVTDELLLKALAKQFTNWSKAMQDTILPERMMFGKLKLRILFVRLVFLEDFLQLILEIVNFLMRLKNFFLLQRLKILI